MGALGAGSPGVRGIMTTEIIGKACTGCGSFKLFSEYTKHKRRSTGIRDACKLCTNAGEHRVEAQEPRCIQSHDQGLAGGAPERAKA